MRRGSARQGVDKYCFCPESGHRKHRHGLQRTRSKVEATTSQHTSSNSPVDVNPVPSENSVVIGNDGKFCVNCADYKIVLELHSTPKAPVCPVVSSPCADEARIRDSLRMAHPPILLQIFSGAHLPRPSSSLARFTGSRRRA